MSIAHQPSMRFESQYQQLKEQLPAESLDIISVQDRSGYDFLTITVKSSSWILLIETLQKKYGFDFLADLTATDETPRSPRFNLVCHLRRTKDFVSLRVVTHVDEKIPSLVALFTGANWAEREVFDMFGIHFENHPRLRRILMHDDYQGHPLRKDYPLKGYQLHPSTAEIDPSRMEVES